MRIKACVARFGPIPPMGGEGRVEFLLQRGGHTAKEAAAAFSAAEDAVFAIIGRRELPYLRNYFANETLDDRLDHWKQLRRHLVERVRVGPVPGEEAGRKALLLAVEASHDLAETSRQHTAHIQVHRIGEFVSGLYGCWHERDADGIWWETCPVRLTHIPFGNSPGFTAKRVCSICREDISECDHLPSVTYPVVADRTEQELCSVCGEPSCDHELGVTYDVYPSALIEDPVMHESSLTPQPREPRARITAVEIERDAVPPGSDANRTPCVACLLACPGVPGPEIIID